MKCRGSTDHKGTHLVQSGTGRYKKLCDVCFVWIGWVYDDEVPGEFSTNVDNFSTKKGYPLKI